MSRFLQFIKGQKNLAIFLGSIFLLCSVTDAYAQGENLGSMAESMRESLSKFSALIGTGSYVVGLGFAIGAIMKFKQHKDNPSNIPIGTPMALLFVAVALVFLPSLIQMTGSTMTLQKTAGDEGKFDLSK